VVGRELFYNNSRFDGRNPAPNQADLAAVATDKRALLPGQFASSLNVTGYTRGINGVMIELRNLAPAANPTAADFLFKAGAGIDPSTWPVAPPPAQVTTLRSVLPEEPARVLITWPDGAIVNKWLQVTMLANANTGLREPDVFYFGNLVGESNDQPSHAPIITMRDVLAVRRELGTRNATVTNRVDFDRDGDVDAMDLLAVRKNIGGSLSGIGGQNTGAPGPTGASVFSNTPLAPARVWDEQAVSLI
jgi:hypothetical protein